MNIVISLISILKLLYYDPITILYLTWFKVAYRPNN